MLLTCACLFFPTEPFNTQKKFILSFYMLRKWIFKTSVCPRSLNDETVLQEFEHYFFPDLGFFRM